MKRILLIASIFLINGAFAQIKTNEEGKVSFVKVDSTKSTKDEIYSKCKEWITANYTNPKLVTQSDDKDKIIIKAVKFITTSVFGYGQVPMDYTLNISIKDNKYKLEITNIVYGNQYYVYRAEDRITDDKVSQGKSKDVKLNGELRTETIKWEEGLLTNLVAAINKKSDF